MCIRDSSYAGKHGKSAMSCRNIVDQLHDQYGFSYTCAAEQTNFTAFCIGTDQIHDLNSGLQNFCRRHLVFICGSWTMAVSYTHLDVYKRQADIRLAVNSIIHSKTFDNGMICASEQSVTVLEKVYQQVKEEFEYRGCYFLKKDELDKVRKTILINGALNAKIVGQKACTIAEMAGVTVPAETKILIGEVESVDISEEFAHEKLSPVLAMYKAKTFDEAIQKAEQLVADGGYGHTASLYLSLIHI